MKYTIETKIKLDTESEFYKNCKRQRKNEAKICQSCPFRIHIEKEENRHPEDKCERCGGKNIIWYTDNELWNKYAKGKYSILCPVCFAELTGTHSIWKLSQK